MFLHEILYINFEWKLNIFFQIIKVTITSYYAYYKTQKIDKTGIINNFFAQRLEFGPHTEPYHLVHYNNSILLQ